MSVFIGGDTEEKEFDFSTKVSDSLLECPLRIYNSVSPKLLNPNDVTSNWKTGWDKAVEKNQTEIDKIKKSDGTVLCTTLKGTEKYITKYMVEVDLNPLCKSKFGGSHEALKSAIKKLDANAWASGSGNDSGKVGHKCIMSIWRVSDQTWINPRINNTSYINRINHTEKTYQQDRLTKDNKIYILIASGYPSSATIPSTLNLDYINVKLTLARIPDRLKFTDSEGNKKDYLDVNLGDEWSVLLKGVSPAWVENDIDDTTENTRYFLNIIKNNFDRLDIRISKKYQIASMGVQFGKRYKYENWKINNFPTKKFTNINYLVQQKDKKIICYWTDENGFNKQEIPHIMPNDFYKLFIATYDSSNGQLDGFIERFNFFDYAIANTDNEAEVILKGRNEIDVNNNRLNELEKQFKNPNIAPLFSDERWYIYPNAGVREDGKTLTINSSREWQESYIYIPILPNNKYKISCDNKVISGEGNPLGIFREYCNNTLINDHGDIVLEKNRKTAEFITDSKTNILRIIMSPSKSGTYTFSNLELRRLD